jgi:hypothetical protein
VSWNACVLAGCVHRAHTGQFMVTACDGVYRLPVLGAVAASARGCGCAIMIAVGGCQLQAMLALDAFHAAARGSSLSGLPGRIGKAAGDSSGGCGIASQRCRQRPLPVAEMMARRWDRQAATPATCPCTLLRRRDVHMEHIATCSAPAVKNLGHARGGGACGGGQRCLCP